MNTETDFQGEIDRLQAAPLAALKMVRGGILLVTCPSCESGKYKPCWENGLMILPHEVRNMAAIKRLDEILTEACDAM